MTGRTTRPDPFRAGNADHAGGRMAGAHRFQVNGRAVEVDAAPASRLTRVLRDHLGLTGTKVGCDAGDCGACTVLLDGEQVCACLVPLGQVRGRSVTTVEGLAENGSLSRLQRAFHEHGAAQCGICTPGMLMAASTLLGHRRPPTEPEVLDALGGVLCRCTGYRKIVRAVLAAANGATGDTTGGATGGAMGDTADGATGGAVDAPADAESESQRRLEAHDQRSTPRDTGSNGGCTPDPEPGSTVAQERVSGGASELTPLRPGSGPQDADSAPLADGERPSSSASCDLRARKADPLPSAGEGQAGTNPDAQDTDARRYVGRRLPSVDGPGKVSGRAVFGADGAPAGALRLRVVRSPHAHARFTLGDCSALHERHPGLARILTAADVPGVNGFGIYPDVKDQPVLAPGIVRYRGEAILALVGDEDTLARLTDDRLPIGWEPLPALSDPRDALAAGTPPVNPNRPDNVLARGRVHAGEVPPPGGASPSGGSAGSGSPDNGSPGDDPPSRASPASYPSVSYPSAGSLSAGSPSTGGPLSSGPSVSGNLIEACGEFETPFIEHAYIEPEAGWAQRIEGGRIEVVACTQTPYMDRDEVANVLGIAPGRVRIRPSACGGGFGGKLDQSVQPLVALAAWVLDAPVCCAYTRPESMAATTKRHSSRIRARAVAEPGGRLLGYEFDGDFDTGAYASWGPTVAGRVPVHCMGPYRVPNVRAEARAIFTHSPPAGAFRGFGVPQAAVAHETLIDELAVACGIDPLEFRRRNALRAGDRTATGQVLEASAGLVACLDALRPHWKALRREADAFNASAGPRRPHLRRGVGIACMWYGCGNTSMSNPSAMRVTLSRHGRVVFYNGAQDIGQGSSTVMLQILAEALGLPIGRIEMVVSDTDLTEDAGKSSASRQTFVSGRAAQRAGADLRAKILALANAGPDAGLRLDGEALCITGEDGVEHTVALARLPVVEGEDVVLEGRGVFDPPTSPLDENGQGVPYATYGFAAQIASVEVDLELGTVALRRIVAAHDVGAAVNPALVEGQIEGGVAQGIGLALMEEYVPGRTENLHDYLLPSVGDVPGIECLLVEDPEPLGPYGAKGIGEPALIPTAPAILNAVHHATGMRLRRLPILPHRVRAALEAGGRP